MEVCKFNVLDIIVLMKEEIPISKSIALFESKGIRKAFRNNQWYLSVIDVVGALTDSSIPKRYWSDLKGKLRDEGSQVYDKIVQLKFEASDGKNYETDCFAVADILRLIQSIPSPKAEPFKLWLARVGKERIDEIQDPELAVNRAKTIYERKGYPKGWIDKRMRGINVRNTLTDEWKERGASAGNDFAILTDEIYHGTFEMTAQEYKNHKALGKENNLRDHMNDIELILTMLGEATTTNLSQNRDSKGIGELHKDAKDGGAVAGRTRKDIEKQSKTKVISEENFLPKSSKHLK
jgi:hypothetical protein